VRVNVNIFVPTTVDRTVNVEGHCLFGIDDCQQFLVTFRQLLARSSPNPVQGKSHVERHLLIRELL